MKLISGMIIFLGLIFPLCAQETRSFVDPSRGYTIAYAPPLELRGGSYSSNAARRDTHYVHISVEGTLILRGEFNDIQRRHKNFRAHAIDVAILSSGADGPDGSVWCENIDSVRIAKNPAGLTYAEMYFRKKAEGAGGERSGIVGPFFVIDLSAHGVRQSLYLDWRPAWKPSDMQTEVSRMIVESISFLP